MIKKEFPKLVLFLLQVLPQLTNVTGNDPPLF